MSTTHYILHGRASTVVIEQTGTAMPIWRHWGERLTLTPDSALAWSTSSPVPSFSLDTNIALSVFPLSGNGWFGPSALLAHRNGRDWAHDPTLCTVEQSGNSLVITCADDIAGLALRVTLTLDPQTDVLTLSSEVTNTGTAPLDLSHFMSGCLPLPDIADRVQSFSGRHNNEFIPESSLLNRDGWHRENRRGLTSHDCPPLASVLTRQTGQHSGPVWSAQLAWSGNHVQSIDWNDDGRWAWMAGEWLAPGEVQLAAGETLTAPHWLATFTPDGLDAAAQNFHAALRLRSPLGADTPTPRPVHLNTWEALYFDHDEADLMSLATAAKDIGIERFVLDDGWFKGRHDDTAALGDWVADTTKYPNGLAPLVKHVRGLGLEFGLWVEPEMINPDSDLYRAHPDWALHLDGRTSLTARNQLVLDLTRKDVSDYLFEHLDGLLSDLDISYLKWDHNRDLTQAGTQGRPAYRRQVLATYALIDRLRETHPSVEIEACAGGGGRIDAGILARTHRVWTSDCIDAVSRTRIQYGFLQYFPPEIMGSHIGASPAHSTGRRQSMAFRAMVALPGHLGVELDPRRVSPDDRAELSEWIRFYKSIRDDLHSGPVWRGEAGDGITWQVHGTEDGFIAFIYRLAPTGQKYPPLVRLPFVDPTASYSVQRIDPLCGQHDGAVCDQFLAMEAGELTLPGSWLRSLGLALPHMKAERGLVIRGVRQPA